MLCGNLDPRIRPETIPLKSCINSHCFTYPTPRRGYKASFATFRLLTWQRQQNLTSLNTNDQVPVQLTENWLKVLRPAQANLDQWTQILSKAFTAITPIFFVPQSRGVVKQFNYWKKTSRCFSPQVPSYELTSSPTIVSNYVNPQTNWQANISFPRKFPWCSTMRANLGRGSFLIPNVY